MDIVTLKSFRRPKAKPDSTRGASRDYLGMDVDLTNIQRYPRATY
jgi:hypothetical protein